MTEYQRGQIAAYTAVRRFLTNFTASVQAEKWVTPVEQEVANGLIRIHNHYIATIDENIQEVLHDGTQSSSD